MLVMTRKRGEEILIGGTPECPAIVIQIIDFDRGKVKVGVTSPRGLVPVARAEILPEAERERIVRLASGQSDPAA